MAMPRPGGRALEIAEKVVPGLARHKKKSKNKKSSPVFLSPVEERATSSIIGVN